MYACERCTTQYSHLTRSLKLWNAVDHDRVGKMPGFLKSWIESLTDPNLTRNQVAGLDRDDSVSGLGDEAGFCAVLWAAYCQHHGTITHELNVLAAAVHDRQTPGGLGAAHIKRPSG